MQTAAFYTGDILMQNTIDKNLFSEACQKMIGALQGQNGIGTLREKTIHSVLKYYYAPDPIYHEIKIGPYVADICVDGEIFEVQTRNFNTMRSKLDFFLKEHDVTIIYPVAHKKWLSWLDTETGELSPKRKSPKTGTFYQIIPELYKIKMFISNPKLHFIISLIDVEETRYLTFALGKGRLAKKTLELFEEIGITCEEMKDKDSRKLVFVNKERKLRFFLAKGPDVPTYVEYGAADIGVVGKDTVME